MKISKQDALIAALKMTENKRTEINKLENEIKSFAYNAAFASIKKEVINFYLTHKNYFKTTTSVSLSGIGLSSIWIFYETPLPSTDACSISVILSVSDAKKITHLINKKEDLTKRLKSLQKDIEIAIISLGTTAKIESEFKEAIAFLPVKIKAELTVNIKDIKARL